MEGSEASPAAEIGSQEVSSSTTVTALDYRLQGDVEQGPISSSQPSASTSHADSGEASVSTSHNASQSYRFMESSGSVAVPQPVPECYSPESTTEHLEHQHAQHHYYEGPTDMLGQVIQQAGLGLEPLICTSSNTHNNENCDPAEGSWQGIDRSQASAMGSAYDNRTSAQPQLQMMHDEPCSSNAYQLPRDQISSRNSPVVVKEEEPIIPRVSSVNQQDDGLADPSVQDPGGVSQVAVLQRVDGEIHQRATPSTSAVPSTSQSSSTFVSATHSHGNSLADTMGQPILRSSETGDSGQQACVSGPDDTINAEQFVNSANGVGTFIVRQGENLLTLTQTEENNQSENISTADPQPSSTKQNAYINPSLESANGIHEQQNIPQAVSPLEVMKQKYTLNLDNAAGAPNSVDSLRINHDITSALQCSPPASSSSVTEFSPNVLCIQRDANQTQHPDNASHKSVDLANSSPTVKVEQDAPLIDNDSVVHQENPSLPSFSITHHDENLQNTSDMQPSASRVFPERQDEVQEKEQAQTNAEPVAGTAGPCDTTAAGSQQGSTDVEMPSVSQFAGDAAEPVMFQEDERQPPSETSAMNSTGDSAISCLSETPEGALDNNPKVQIQEKGIEGSQVTDVCQTQTINMNMTSNASNVETLAHEPIGTCRQDTEKVKSTSRIDKITNISESAGAETENSCKFGVLSETPPCERVVSGIHSEENDSVTQDDESQMMHTSTAVKETESQPEEVVEPVPAQNLTEEQILGILNKAIMKTVVALYGHDSTVTVTGQLKYIAFNKGQENVNIKVNQAYCLDEKSPVEEDCFLGGYTMSHEKFKRGRPPGSKSRPKVLRVSKRKLPELHQTEAPHKRKRGRPRKNEVLPKRPGRKKSIPLRRVTRLQNSVDVSSEEEDDLEDATKNAQEHEKHKCDNCGFLTSNDSVFKNHTRRCDQSHDSAAGNTQNQAAITRRSTLQTEEQIKAGPKKARLRIHLQQQEAKEKMAAAEEKNTETKILVGRTKEVDGDALDLTHKAAIQDSGSESLDPTDDVDDEDPDYMPADAVGDSSAEDVKEDAQNNQTRRRVPRRTRKSDEAQVEQDTNEDNKGYTRDGILFKCKRCPYQTDHSRHIIDHVNTHLGIKPYACEMCDKRFTKPVDLKRHQALHDREYKCDQCSMDFSSKREMSSHFRTAHGLSAKDIYFICTVCRKQCLSQEDLDKHMSATHEHICSICGETFKVASELRRHRTKVHSEETLLCSVCNKQFQSESAYNRHAKRHTEEKCSCDVCGKMFSSQGSLYHHKKALHSGVKQYKCDQCGKEFNFYHSLKLHRLQHEGKRPYKCDQCGKSYLTANHLKSHKEGVHATEKKYKCVICNKAFPYENSLRLHTLLHTGTRPYQCEICGKGFVNKGALKTHLASHEEGKNYPCDKCNKVFKAENLLRAHWRRHTEDGSRFMCDICGLTFMYRSNLEQHSAVHGDERKFTCTTCGKSFKTMATLYSHRLVHVESKPFSCSVCGKSFKSKDRVLAHEKRHTGLKPFQCELCGNAFPDKGGLSKHMKTVHCKVKRFACPVCGKQSSRMDNLRVHMKTHPDKNVSMVQVFDGDEVSTMPLAPMKSGTNTSPQNTVVKATASSSNPVTLTPSLTVAVSPSDTHVSMAPPSTPHLPAPQQMQQHHLPNTSQMEHQVVGPAMPSYTVPAVHAAHMMVAAGTGYPELGQLQPTPAEQLHVYSTPSSQNMSSTVDASAIQMVSTQLQQHQQQHNIHSNTPWNLKTNWQ